MSANVHMIFYSDISVHFNIHYRIHLNASLQKLFANSIIKTMLLDKNGWVNVLTSFITVNEMQQLGYKLASGQRTTV